MQRVVGQFLPRPPQMKSPLLWGTEERVRELLGEGVGSLNMRHRTFTFRFESPERWLDFHRANLGPAARAFASMDADTSAKLAQSLLDLTRRCNRSGDETLIIPAEYL